MPINYTLPFLDELPPSMRTRAVWAREQILNNPESAEIDEDELLAWVYSEEDKVWYSIAGNYSASSPADKMAKRRLAEKRNVTNYERMEEETIKRQAQQAYWSSVRKRILERDNYTCQRCDQEFEKYHIHHIVKSNEDGSDADDNLLTVCHKCHHLLDNKEYGCYYAK